MKRNQMIKELIDIEAAYYRCGGGYTWEWIEHHLYHGLRGLNEMSDEELRAELREQSEIRSGAD